MITAHTRLLQHKSGEKLARKYIENGAHKAFATQKRRKTCTQIHRKRRLYNGIFKQRKNLYQQAQRQECD